MREVMSQLHRGLAWLTLGGLVVQFYLAGAAAFGATSFAPHIAWGYLLGLPILVLPLLALVGALGRRRIGLSLALLALYTVQLGLAYTRSSQPYVAALHALNALALLGVTAQLTRAAPLRGAGTVQPEPARYEAEPVAPGKPPHSS